MPEKSLAPRTSSLLKKLSGYVLDFLLAGSAIATGTSGNKIQAVGVQALVTAASTELVPKTGRLPCFSA